MARPIPRVFTIPPSVPFLPTLIESLLGGTLIPGFPPPGDPLAFAAATLYLPTRRACRLARDLFCDILSGEAAMLLPRILPIGDVDEDELVFAELASGPPAADVLDIPPALGGFERRMLLAELALKWAASPEIGGDGHAPLVACNPVTALALADNLARLMDDMETRKVAWEALDRLVPERFDAYWQLTLRFLKVVRAAWPKILAEQGAIEPAERRDRLIAAEAARLRAADGGPVIAAGSTGSMPATAELLATIAALPRGAVVLPGLDTDLDSRSWSLIAGGDAGGEEVAPAVGHPQYAMNALLRRIGINRSEVGALAPPAPHGRDRLVSHALCPAVASECWQQRLPDAEIAAALAGVAVVEAANAEEEALAIAVALREAVDQKGRTAALVTPDRALARRVIAALARWKVAVDDSGGDRLNDAPAGVFATLVADAALSGLAPVATLALLKHPLAHLGSPSGNARAVAALELAVLRGPRPRPKSSGLAHALAAFRRERSGLRRSDPRRALGRAELDAAAALVSRLATALAPLENLEDHPLPLAEIAARHREAVAAVSAASGIQAAFAGDDGAALAAAFDDISGPAATRLAVAPADYPELFRTFIADRVLHRPSDPSVRVRIFGLLEARLQTADLVILGGLIEGTWPPEARTDAWLSRPMRHDLGLDLPERRIGLTAHDFAQALGAPQVILTRAARIAGAPTLPSRFVQRLAAVADESHWRAAVARGERYLALARRLDQPDAVAPAKQPAPMPPRAARPLRLSVTEIEHWLRDPYAIYARHILRLAPLPAVDTPPGAADRGSVIHAAIGEFTQTFAERLPADIVGELLAIGCRHFAPLDDFPEARAFWWPRFVRIAHWFAGWEAERRRAATATLAEIRGEIALPIGARVFCLSARADRIEQRSDGSYAIIDFKTGQVPSEKQVHEGFAPQLTLEAAILRRGGFPGIGAGASVGEVAYVRLRGGAPAGEEKAIAFKEGTPDSQADRALDRLVALVRRFEDETMPYKSRVQPMWTTHDGDYDHLARVKEWSLTAGEAGGGE